MRGYEADLPTLKKKAPPETRFSSSLEDGRWPAGPWKKKEKRPVPPRSCLKSSWKGSHLILWSGPTERRRDWRIIVNRSLVRRAPQRNRWRRRIREILRKYERSMEGGRSVHIKVYQLEVKEPNFQSLEKEIKNLLEESGVLR